MTKALQIMYYNIDDQNFALLLAPMQLCLFTFYKHKGSLEIQKLTGVTLSVLDVFSINNNVSFFSSTINQQLLDIFVSAMFVAYRFVVGRAEDSRVRAHDQVGIQIRRFAAGAKTFCARKFLSDERQTVFCIAILFQSE